MPWRVFVSDKTSEKGLEILREAEGIELDYRPGLTGAALEQALAPADALIIRSATKVTADLIAKAPQLRAVARAGAGVDNVDLPAAARRGILVMNTPGGNNVATGEHTIAMIMALSRRIPQAHGALKAGRWEKSQNVGVEVFRKTLGVLGFGNVGRVVASRGLGLGMRVLVHDPFVVAEKIAETGAVPVAFEELLQKADYVTVHVPKGEKTLNMIDRLAISQMKKGVRIINCARGGIVNEQDLLEALQSGQVAGAAIDVYPQEPCTDSPLFQSDNVVVTPHLGASTGEAQENVAIAAAEQIIDYLQKGIIKNAVNAPAVEPELLARMQPALNLAGKIGSLLGQVLDKAPNAVRLFLGGEFAAFPWEPLQAAALTGLLPHFGGSTEVNPINAPYLTKERGIALQVNQRETLKDFVNVIGLEARFADGKVEIQGSIPARGEERIVKLGDYSISFEPEGRMLLVQNRDVPGVVGEVGTLLGAKKINIGQLRLGRIKDKKQALMVVTVDSEVEPVVIEALRTLPNVESARLVSLKQ